MLKVPRITETEGKVWQKAKKQRNPRVRKEGSTTDIRPRRGGFAVTISVTVAAVVKNPPAVRRRTGCRCDPWVGEIPWRRRWQPTPVFLPGESRNRGAWRAVVHRLAKKRLIMRRNCERLLPVLFSLCYLFTVQSPHRSFRLSETVSYLECPDCQGRSEDDGREEGPVSFTFHSGSCGAAASTQLPFWTSSIYSHPSAHIHSYPKDASFLLNVTAANELLYSLKGQESWFFSRAYKFGSLVFHFIYLNREILPFSL